MERGKRNYKLIGRDKIKCDINCNGRLSQNNSPGQFVCDAFGAPAKDGEFVGRFTHTDEERICLLLNDIPSDSNSTR